LSDNGSLIDQSVPKDVIQFNDSRDISENTYYECKPHSDLMSPLHESKYECISKSAEPHALVEPPCISGKATRETVDKWIDAIQVYLKGRDQFASLLDAKWSKSARVHFRDLEDDPVTGHPASYRDLQLKQLFNVLSETCPLNKTYMSVRCTSLESIWPLVYQHFGYFD